jgi:hypothetical protein
MRAAAALAALFCGLGGCRHPAPAPADALAAFGGAMERQDWGTAYGLMSATYRARVSRAEFERQLRAAPRENSAAGAELLAHAESWGGRVGVTLDGQEQVELVRESGAWRFDRPPWEPFAQDTPRAALRAFIRAVETERYDVLVELAPARYRPALTPEKLRRYWQGLGPERTTALLRDLRLAADERIVEEGAEAFLGYGQGRQVHFVREDDSWRIEAPE